MGNGSTIHRGAVAGVFGATLFLSSSAWATTYQVGPGKPHSSLKAVASLLQAGDVVEVSGNTTYAGDVKLTKSGTDSNKITIRGVRVNGKRPVLSGGTNTLEVGADHYVIEGFEVVGGSSRCVFHRGHDITIRDTAVHDCPSHGILGAMDGSGSLTLEYVEVYKAGAGDKRHPIYMDTDEINHPGAVFRMQHCFVHDGLGGHAVKSRAERNEIYYNWIEGAYYRELELVAPDGEPEDVAREDGDIVGNVFRKTGTYFTVRIGSDATGGSTNGRYRFVNNTFLLPQNAKPVVEIFWGIESIEMHNNAFFRAGGGAVSILKLTDVEWAAGKPVIGGQNNWVPQGSTVPSQWQGTIQGSNPKFVDLAAFDLRPAADSPLRDAGAAAPASPAGYPFPSPLATPLFVPPAKKVVTDAGLLGRGTVGAIDIGAYEGAGLGGVRREAEAEAEAAEADADAVSVEENAAGLACAMGPGRTTGAAWMGGLLAGMVMLWGRRRKVRES